MKKSTVAYILGVFAFGSLIAFGLVNGISYSKVLVLGKHVVTRATLYAETVTTTEKSIETVPEEKPKEEVFVPAGPCIDAGKNIVANLKDMTMTLCENAAVVAQYPIIAKGRPGTAWETVTGMYKIMTEEERHYSSIGHVWMPYSMQIYGNYFIHGIPTYDSGAEVPTGYSGGCIRLKTADAKAVYDFVTLGTPVRVIGDKEVTLDLNASYKINNPKKMPKVSAQSYLIADLDTGEILAKKNETALRPTASIAKLMTAVVDLEVINQYQDTLVSDSAVKTYGDQGNLKSGEVYEIKDLIYPLMLESSNDAAEVIAEHYGRNRFLKLMNDKATALGMYSTHFDDPAGLSPQTVSTAVDLMKLSTYIHKYKSFVRQVTQLPQYSVGGHNWHNISHFLNKEGYLGGKNGYTDEAQHTLISMFNLPLSEFSSRNIVIILLDGDKSTKEEDMLAMVDFLSKNVIYTPHDLAGL